MDRIADAYLRFEERDRQAFWETSHYLPIAVQRDADPAVNQYHEERRTRRTRLRDRWRRLLRDTLPVMRDIWTNLDLLLLKIPVHLRDSVHWYPGVVSRTVNAGDPAQQQCEPTDLRTALIEADTDDPWRNQYRDRPQDHSAWPIPRLRNKFYPNIGIHQP